MSSRKRSAADSLDQERSWDQPRDRLVPPAAFTMGVIQSTVRRWADLIFGGRPNSDTPQSSAISENGNNRQAATSLNLNNRSRARSSDSENDELAVREGEEGGRPASKRQRLAPLSSSDSNRLSRQRQRNGSSHHFAQSHQPRSHHGRNHGPFSSSQRNDGRRNASFSQSLNRQSLLRAREKQRAKSIDSRRSQGSSASHPLLTVPKTREEVDSVFTPKGHGLLDAKSAFDSSTTSAAVREDSSTDQSSRHGSDNFFTSTHGSAYSRSSLDSASLQPSRFDGFASVRSKQLNTTRPLRRDSGPAEPIDYAKRIKALLDDDDDQPLLSRRKQQQIDEDNRIREIERLRREKEAEEKRLQEEAEARLKRRTPKKPLIQPLEQEWEDRVNDAIYTNNQGKVVTTSIGGTELIPKDFRTLLGSRSWLNDEIINSYIEWVVDSANKLAPPNKAVGKEKPVPKFIAHNSFFYETIAKKGPTSTDRLMKRKGAPGKSLLQVDSVLVPICSGNHWTVGVVRPAFKTIEYFDSFGGRSRTGVEFKAHMRAWLQHQLGDSYNAKEWSEPDTGCASQTNGWDCGVFVCTNAFCVAFGLETSCYVERDMETQRRRIAAVLINRGFHGDFSWANAGW